MYDEPTGPYEPRQPTFMAAIMFVVFLISGGYVALNEFGEDTSKAEIVLGYILIWTGIIMGYLWIRACHRDSHPEEKK